MLAQSTFPAAAPRRCTFRALLTLRYALSLSTLFVLCSNFKWAITHITLSSPDYPLSCVQIFRIAEHCARAPTWRRANRAEVLRAVIDRVRDNPHNVMRLTALVFDTEDEAAEVLGNATVFASLLQVRELYTLVR